MALSRRQRAKRAAHVLVLLRDARLPHARGVVTLALQRGRRRERITGRVVHVAASGAFVLLAVGDEVSADESIGERARDPLHVPVDVIRSVHYS